MPPADFDFEACYFNKPEFEEVKRRAKQPKDLVAELLGDLDTEPEPSSAHFDIDQYFKEREQTSQRRVREIRHEIDIRQRIPADFVKQIDLQISYAALALEKFSHWGVGYTTGVDVKRNHLERQLLQFRIERRAAELRTWEDMIKLRKELREAMAEYRSAARLRAHLP